MQAALLAAVVLSTSAFVGCTTTAAFVFISLADVFWFILSSPASPKNMFEDEDQLDDEETLEITSDQWQEACWIVISSYFDEKGLVRQQLDSFDEFIQMSVQRIVEDSSTIEIEVRAFTFDV